MQLVDLHPTYVNKYVRRGESHDTPPRETLRKDRPDRWNLEGGTVPSAGARFNLNLTLSLLRYACRDVTVSKRCGNTLVTDPYIRCETRVFVMYTPNPAASGDGGFGRIALSKPRRPTFCYEGRGAGFPANRGYGNQVSAKPS